MEIVLPDKVEERISMEIALISTVNLLLDKEIIMISEEKALPDKVRRKISREIRLISNGIVLPNKEIVLIS